MKIEKSRIINLSDIVECHLNAFPNSLSSKQGKRFISKMLEWYIISERGILFHIYNKENKIVGYCGGIITRYAGLLGAVSSIYQYAFYDFWICFFRKPWLVFHPNILNKFPYIVKNILIKLGFKSNNQNIKCSIKDEFEPFMGLVVIGVKKQYHSKGYGGKLLQEFEHLAKLDKGIKKIQLSVKANNYKAIKSYQRNGWIMIKEDDKTKKFQKFI